MCGPRTNLVERIGKEIEKALKKIVPRRERHAPTIYLKAIPLSDLSDVGKIKSEVEIGNVVICYLRPLADKDIGLVTRAVSELATFVRDSAGDIAKLGEERVIVTPPSVRIWREGG